MLGQTGQVMTQIGVAAFDRVSLRLALGYEMQALMVVESFIGRKAVGAWSMIGCIV